MEDCLGLLLSFSEGINFPKKKIYLTVRYSKYSISFPVVHGGEKTVFNQGYFFRNIKVDGHDESNLPLLIQAYEKKTLYTNALIAELRVEAFNFYNYDFYEPSYLCLTPVEAYKKYECQLKLVVQLVKPSAVFVCPKNVDVNAIKPIAYQFEILTASLKEEVVDKKLYFSCRLNINKDSYVKTRDDKGVSPQWGVKCMAASCDFADSNELSLTIYSVTHPHQPKSSKTVGTATITFKRILSTVQPRFSLPILVKKQEVGTLNLTIRPVYPQSRDGIASQDRINSLQPNISVVNTMMGFSIQQTSSSLSSLRNTANMQPSASSHPSPIPPLGESMAGESIRDQVLGNLSTKMGLYDSYSVTTDANKVSMGTELKKVVVATPVEEVKSVDLSTVYVSKCTSIIRKSDSTNVQGLRMMNRVKHDYIESLSYVLYACLFTNRRSGWS